LPDTHSSTSISRALWQTRPSAPKSSTSMAWGANLQATWSGCCSMLQSVLFPKVYRRSPVRRSPGRGPSGQEKLRLAADAKVSRNLSVTHGYGGRRTRVMTSHP
jgi:hypothetical protein